MKSLLVPLAILTLVAVSSPAVADCLDYVVPTHVYLEQRCEDGVCYQDPCFVFVGERDCRPYYHDTCA